ncbi:EscU/YscU/HrcU family type III secretion system export apparatus switch protein [bacterium]|nr:EscU/YscU/HrcU family type III secretion system export apparatus switch protein [bacterium]
MTKSGASPQKGVYECAVGLAYRDAEEAAPQVVVKGSGERADAVVRLARRFGVPVVEKGEISELLSGIPLDEEIPHDLYEAVALILSELKSLS